MKRLVQKVAQFLKREDGPTAVEYAVMLALIIVVCLVAITTLGSQANDTFSNVGNKLKTASSWFPGARVPGLTVLMPCGPLLPLPLRGAT